MGISRKKERHGRQINYSRINKERRRKAGFGTLFFFLSRTDTFAWTLFLEYLCGYFLSALQVIKNSSLVLSGSIHDLDFSSKFHLLPSLTSKF